MGAQGIRLSVPGKTFLVGEYLALKGGPSLLACTEPRFVLNLISKKTRSDSPSVFHEQSPAGKFLKDHSKFFSHWEVTFHDPYKGIGGFGASTAQFAMVYMAELIMREGELNSDDLQWGELLRDYHLYAYSGVGEPPSGADLIAQLTGGIALYDGVKLDVQSVQWQFTDIGFLLFHTGNKLATHEHLKSKFDIPVDALRNLAQQATRALSTTDAQSLVGAVQNYGECLSKNGLQAVESGAKLNWIIQNARTGQGASPVLASKACGAMGADVLLVVYKKAHEFLKAEDWRGWLNSKGNPQGLNLVASDETISAGLRIEEVES